MRHFISENIPFGYLINLCNACMYESLNIVKTSCTSYVYIIAFGHVFVWNESCICMNTDCIRISTVHVRRCEGPLCQLSYASPADKIIVLRLSIRGRRKAVAEPCKITTKGWGVCYPAHITASLHSAETRDWTRDHWYTAQQFYLHCSDALVRSYVALPGYCKLRSGEYPYISAYKPSLKLTTKLSNERVGLYGRDSARTQTKCRYANFLSTNTTLNYPSMYYAFFTWNTIIFSNIFFKVSRMLDRLRVCTGLLRFFNHLLACSIDGSRLCARHMQL